MRSQEKTWDKLGRLAPYYSVLVAEEFKPENLTTENLAAFFASGRGHVTRLMEIVHEFRPGYMPRTVLDFGCGVGRVTIPLAEASDRVIAVDISEPMLEQARENCRSRNLANVEFMTSGEFLQLPEACVNFVHSYIVLQHIPKREGYALIGKLISVLQEGGVGAIHVSFHDQRSSVRRLLSWTKSHVPGAARMHSLLRRDGANYPPMQMNAYRLDTVFQMLYEGDCHRVLTHFSRHGPHLGLLLIFEKTPQESF